MDILSYILTIPDIKAPREVAFALEHPLLESPPHVSRAVKLDCTMTFDFFDTVDLRLPTKEEVEGLIAEISSFYNSVFLMTYHNFESIEVQGKTTFLLDARTTIESVFSKSFFGFDYIYRNQVHVGYRE